MYDEIGAFDIVRTNKLIIAIGIASLILTYTPLRCPHLYAVTIACMLVSILLTCIIYLR